MTSVYGSCLVCQSVPEGIGSFEAPLRGYVCKSAPWFGEPCKERLGGLLAGLPPSGKNLQPAASSSLLSLIRAIASLGSIMLQQLRYHRHDPAFFHARALPKTTQTIPSLIPLLKGTRNRWTSASRSFRDSITRPSCLLCTLRAAIADDYATLAFRLVATFAGPPLPCGRVHQVNFVALQHLL